MAFFIFSFLSILSFAAPLIGADYVLYTGEVLMAGQSLTNGAYKLTMQKNCDLVLYYDNIPTWQAINVDEKHEYCYLGLKQTGELVIRTDIHYTLWSSTNKAKKGKYALVLDSNGSLNVYGSRRWTSNNQKELAEKPGRSAVEAEYLLYSGDRLTLGRKLVYREYELGFNRCNLVINNTRSGQILWQTSTKSNGCYLQLENNGELILKHVNQKLWSSNKKASNGMYIAVLRFDGRLAVYGPLVWSNNNNYALDQV